MGWFICSTHMLQHMFEGGQFPHEHRNAFTEANTVKATSVDLHMMNIQYLSFKHSFVVSSRIFSEDLMSC